MTYMVGGDESLRNAFIGAVECFSSDDLRSFEEDQCIEAFERDSENQISRFKALADMSNYREEQVEGAVRWKFQLPGEILAEDEGFLAAYQQNERAISVMMWADKSIANRRAMDGYTVEKAVGVVSEMLSQTCEGDSTLLGQHIRSAYSGTMAVGLMLEYEWMESQGLVEDGVEGLRQIAATSVPGFRAHADEARHPFCAEVYAIHGLCAVLEIGQINDVIRHSLRELILTKAADASVQIVEAVCENCGRIWQHDSILGHTIANLVLSLSLIPKRVAPLSHNEDKLKQWKQATLETHLERLRDGRSESFPRMNAFDETFVSDKLASVILRHLPLEKLAQEENSREQLTVLARDLLERSIADISEGAIESRHRQDFVFHWVAALARWLPPEITRDDLLRRVQEHWPAFPLLTVKLLEAYIQMRLFHENPPLHNTLEEWNTICEWVFNTPARDLSVGRQEQDIDEAIGLIVFSRFTCCYFSSQWPHAGLFRSTLERWVSIFGSVAPSYSDLLTTLETLGHCFDPETQVKWVHDCHFNATDLRRFVSENSNGENTARFLTKLWRESNRLDGLPAECLGRFARLVDALVANGIAIASILQHQLNERQK